MSVQLAKPDTDTDPGRPPAFDRDAAAALIRTSLGIAPLALRPQARTDSGNAVFRVDLPDDRRAVLRISPHRAAFSHTEPNLDALRALGLPVQTVLATGETGSGRAFVVLDWLPGRDLIDALPTMRADRMAAFAERVTDCQRRVTTLPESRGFGWAPIGRHAQVARWTEIFGAPVTDEPVADGERPLDRLRARLRAVRRTLEPYFGTVRPTCFLDDLTTKNVLAHDGELSGIIDVDVVCYGDPLLSVGATLAHLEADVGPCGRAYGDALVESCRPVGDALRALRFYGALWAIGLLSAAGAAGDATRAQALEPIADAMLRHAETA